MMLSFDDMKQKYKRAGTIGRQLKQMSDEIMQETFENDIQTRQCYLYDYYHDDQSEYEYGYNPILSKTKIPAKLKFIVKTYKSLSKDDPECHIQFEPNVWNSMSCKPDWFIKNYEKFGVEFPVGLLCDIPDDRGIYHRWLIMYLEVANQFVKCGVLRCNYKFQWIENDGIYRYKRQMWGVNSSQSSYTSGVWTDYKTSTYDNQDKFYLPWNAISSELRHDTRLCISMLQREPWTYRITKVDNTSTKGIVTFTIKQDKFEPDHDYVQLDPGASDYGDMYSDYYSSTVQPEQETYTEYTDHSIESLVIDHSQYKLIIEAPNYTVKLGNSKILTAKIFNAEGKDVTDKFVNFECIWNFKVEGTNFVDDKLVIVDKSYQAQDTNKFKCKFEFNGNEQYLMHKLVVTCKIDDLFAEVELDIMAL